MVLEDSFHSILALNPQNEGLSPQMGSVYHSQLWYLDKQKMASCLMSSYFVEEINTLCLFTCGCGFLSFHLCLQRLHHITSLAHYIIFPCQTTLVCFWDTDGSEAEISFFSSSCQHLSNLLFWCQIVQKVCINKIQLTVVTSWQK